MLNNLAMDTVFIFVLLMKLCVMNLRAVESQGKYRQKSYYVLTL